MSKSIISYVTAIVIVAAVIVGAFAITAHAQTQTPAQTPAYSPAPSTGGSSSSAGQPAGGSSSSAGNSSVSTGGSSSSAGSASAPSTGGSSSTAGNVAGTPPTGGSSSTAGNSGTPPTGGSSSTAGNTGGTPPTGGSSSTAGSGSSVVNPPVSGGGSYSSGGSSSSGSYVSGYSSGIITCPLFTTYLHIGANNNPTDVSKLQAFLKNNEKLNVDVTGSFDQKTFDGVVAFQNKYFQTIMGPWGVNKSSGYVYITTLKKINQLACNQPLNLTPSELAIINSFKNSQAVKVTNSAPAVNEVETIGNNSTPTNVPMVTLEPQAPEQTPVQEVGLNGENSSAYTAAAGNTSILHRFWNFIVSLFK